MEEKFSLYEKKLTNEELNITYKPDSSIIKYTYKLLKDNELYDEVIISSNKEVVINLNESGSYKIIVENYDQTNNISNIESGIYNLDLDKPIIKINDNFLQMRQLNKDEQLTYDDLKEVITVIDKHDGNIFDKMTCNLDSIDFTKVGLYNLKCIVSDEAGNITEKNIKFNIIKSNQKFLNMSMISILLILIIIIIFLLRYKKALFLERKIEKYSIEPLKVKRKTLSESATEIFSKTFKRMSKILKKSIFIEHFSEKYKKYLPLYHSFFDNQMDIISFKFLTSLTFAIISIFSKVIRLENIGLLELTIPMLFGFVIPDVLFIIKYKFYRNKLENDLLQAIIVMNNAFKSGRSIIQAIELVTHELKGPIAEEFKKMHLELTFGLSLEVVFKRFSERIKLDEVTYLTASLSILNRTGGNIIKVFSSIEKSLFNKKKLKLEMSALTGASKIIIYVLIIVPIFFIVLVSFISPAYFEPFYTTTLGYVILGIMTVIYIAYILCVRKIMKVRM